MHSPLPVSVTALLQSRSMADSDLWYCVMYNKSAAKDAFSNVN